MESIRLRNLIHPIFVKKSKRYRGIPPLTKTSSAISSINLIPMLKTAEFSIFILKIIDKEVVKSMNVETIISYKNIIIEFKPSNSVG